MRSQEEALDRFWTLLAEMQERARRRAELVRDLDSGERQRVEAALARCDRALRELRAAQRALPPGIKFRGGEQELDQFRRTVNRAAFGFRELRKSWQDRSQGAGG